MRCKSWRFLGLEDQSRHLPVGRDHEAWRPCRNRVDAGEHRCRDCENSLIMCPNTAIRRALVQEPNQSDYVLRSLVSDSNSAIALIAEQALASRDSAAHSAPMGTKQHTSVWAN